MISLQLQVEVSAPDDSDAVDCLLDSLGPGEYTGFRVVDCNIDEIEELYVS